MKLVLILLFFSTSCMNNSSGGGGKKSKDTKKNQNLEGIIQKKITTTIEQRLFCESGPDCINLYPKNDKSITAVIRECQSGNEQARYFGSYQINKGKLQLNFPDLAFTESATYQEVAFDLLLYFESESLKCYITGHNKGLMIDNYLRCPDIKHVPGIGYEKNSFQFYNDGKVKRRRWKELSSDTLYKEFIGSYIIQGNKFYMVFGDSDEGNYFSGTFDAKTGKAFIDELEPKAGPCLVE